MKESNTYNRVLKKYKLIEDQMCKFLSAEELDNFRWIVLNQAYLLFKYQRRKRVCVIYINTWIKCDLRILKNTLRK